MNYDQNDKLQREVEKLTEEIRVLRRPFSQPAAWIPVVILVLSLGSNIWQYYTSEQKKVLIDTQVENAKLTKLQTDRDRQEVEQKRDEAKTDLENIQRKIAGLNEQLNTAKNSANSEEVKKTIEGAQQQLTNLKQAAASSVQNLDTSESNQTSKYRIARDKEREGFQSLLNGDYDKAVAAFQAAEDAYNSYHNVYELARLIQANKAQMNDPAKKKQVFQKIVDQYSYGAPPDLLAQVKTIANQ